MQKNETESHSAFRFNPDIGRNKKRMLWFQLNNVTTSANSKVLRKKMLGVIKNCANVQTSTLQVPK